MRKSWVIKAVVCGIIFLFVGTSIVPNISRNLRADPLPSYIIVHALNPEGIEIASIQGVNQNTVEIYDEDNLIGYGAYNSETHNQPIEINAGNHIIKVNFNGITIEQNISVSEGETQVLTFTFTRTIFDIYSLFTGGAKLTGIASASEIAPLGWLYHYSLLSEGEGQGWERQISAVSRSPYWAAYGSTIMTGRFFGRINVYSEAQEHIAISVDASIEVVLSSSQLDYLLNAITSWAPTTFYGTYPFSVTIGGGDNLINPNFTNWFVNIPAYLGTKHTAAYIRGQCFRGTTISSGGVPIGAEATYFTMPASGSNDIIKIGAGDSSYWFETGASVDSVFTHNEGMTCVSVPYDLLGTGINENENPPTLSLSISGGLQVYEGGYKGIVFRRTEDYPTFQVTSDKVIQSDEEIKVYLSKGSWSETITCNPAGSGGGTWKFDTTWRFTSSSWDGTGTDIPAGVYNAQAKLVRNGNVITSSSVKNFYAIFNTPSGLTTDEKNAFLYGGSRVTDGVWFGVREQDNTHPNWDYGFDFAQVYYLHPYSVEIFNRAISQVDGKTSPSSAANTLLSYEYDLFAYSRDYHTNDIIDLLNNYDEAQCADDANVLTALFRSVGIPSHPVTVDANLDRQRWWFDTWTEAYVNGNWYCYHPHENMGPVTRRTAGNIWSVAEKPDNDLLIMGGPLWSSGDLDDNNEELKFRYFMLDSYGNKIVTNKPSDGRPWPDDGSSGFWMNSWVDELSVDYWGKTHDDPPKRPPEKNVTIDVILDEEEYNIGDVLEATITISNNIDDSITSDLKFEIISDNIRSSVFGDTSLYVSTQQETIPGNDNITIEKQFTIPTDVFLNTKYFVKVSFEEVTSKVSFDIDSFIDISASVPSSMTNDSSAIVTVTITNTQDFFISDITVFLGSSYNINVQNPFQIISSLQAHSDETLSWTINSIEPDLATLNYAISSSVAGNENVIKHFWVLSDPEFDVSDESYLYNTAPGSPVDVEFQVKNIGGLDATSVTVDIDPPTGVSTTTTHWDIPILSGGEEQALQTTLSFTLSDDFFIDIHVEDGSGHTAEGSIYVEINENAPTADANGPHSGNPGESIQFDGSGSSDSDGTIVSYTWDFGDGYMGSGVNPIHAYDNPGNYSVILVVEDNNGDRDTDTSSVTINNPSFANFIFSPYEPTDIEEVYFIDLSIDLDGYVVDWHWDFGDGDTSTDQNPMHQYDDDGIYTVTLIVWDDFDASDTVTQDIEILPFDNIPPTTTKIVSIPKYGPNNEWVTSSTQFNFTATDDLSGVNKTYYRVWYNGVWDDWMIYAGKFTLSGEGKHYLEYYSVDNVGNVEETHNQTHYVDNSPPVVTISAFPIILWPPNHKMKNVCISGSATDAGSGIATVTFTIVDEYDLVEPTLTGFGQIIQLEAWRNGNDMDGRTYTITATATDNLGYVATASTVVRVPHDQGN